MASPAPIIDPLRFAAALVELPLDALYSKAAELRNSITQLRSSNAQMLPFAEGGDADCREAMFENLAVIGRMQERVTLIREEVERRGQRWHDGEDEGMGRIEGVGAQGGGLVGSGIGTEAGEQIWVERGDAGARANGVVGVTAASTNGTGTGSGRLTDEELRRRVEAQLAQDEEGDGVHL
nr:hypothetical protein B0A51_09629 [Rachicladosporium sp. CCFEE 5018]